MNMTTVTKSDCITDNLVAPLGLLETLLDLACCCKIDEEINLNTNSLCETLGLAVDLIKSAIDKETAKTQQ